MTNRERSKARLIAQVQGEHRRITMLEALEVEEREVKKLQHDCLGSQKPDPEIIAHELHDGLAQRLAAALMEFQALGHLQDRNSEEARRIFDVAIKLLSDSLGETRRLIRGLQPPALDQSGVVAAIDCLICEMREREDLEIEFIHRVRFERLARPLETAVFRVVQEALNNACRHSRSKKVRVEVTEREGYVCATIQDWGIGFELGLIGNNTFGLRGIRARATLLAGQANIDTSPGKGTRIIVELPLQADSPESARDLVP